MKITVNETDYVFSVTHWPLKSPATGKGRPEMVDLRCSFAGQWCETPIVIGGKAPHCTDSIEKQVERIKLRLEPGEALAKALDDAIPGLVSMVRACIPSEKKKK